MLYSYIHVDWVFSGQAVRAAECPEWCRGLRGSLLSVSLGGSRARGRPENYKVAETKLCWTQRKTLPGTAGSISGCEILNY